MNWRWWTTIFLMAFFCGIGILNFIIAVIKPFILDWMAYR